MTHISFVEKVEDKQGQYGPQKYIIFKDGDGKKISGWIPADRYKADDWQTGKNLDLVITQNGKFWNFKLPTKQDKVAAKVAESNDAVLNALRKIWAKLSEIERKVDALESKRSNLEPNPIDKYIDPKEAASIFDAQELEF